MKGGQTDPGLEGQGLVTRRQQTDMHTTEAFAGLRCLDCAEQVGPETVGRCPACGGALDPVYDEDALATAHGQLRSADGRAGDRQQAGLGRFAEALPVQRDALVTLAEGATPLVECPTLAAEVGVERVLLKDEGRNGTGGLVDRELALAVTAAREHGADSVALPTTGNGGQAAAAYAARAGLDAQVVAPSRMPFQNKAMINVHDGEMRIVGGRYPDAVAAFTDAAVEYSLAPFDTPYRHEGAKTLAYELAVALDGAPDAVVHPTAHGTGLVGIEKGFSELASTGTVEEVPRLYAAQPAGCAPIVEGYEGGSIEPVEYPDTICGSLEVPDPAGGAYALDALDSADGDGVTTPDEVVLDAALDVTRAGVPASATGGVAVSGARELAEEGAFDGAETVVLVNPATANREADLLRSRLMSEGV
jgi:threonine synthase